MKKSAQQKIKKTTVKKAVRKLGFSWKNLFQFFLMIPVIVLFFLITFSRVDAAAGINQTINFQGKIVNKTGLTNINDGTYSFTFKLYDASSGGNQLWTETQSSVTVTSGIFQVALGSVSSLSGVNFHQDNLWLDITFNGETFGSRIRLAAVSQAFDSQYLDGVVATQSASSFTITGGTSTPRTVTISGADITIGSTIHPTSSGALTVQSTGSNGLTLDTGGAATLSIGTTANAITFGATNNPNYAFNGTGTVTFQGTSFTLGNGSTATLQTTGNSGLTFLPSGTGNIILGQSNGVGDIVVQPDAGGSAALIVNKQGGLGLTNPNLFVASAAGVLKFSVDSGGNATAAASLNVGYPTIGFGNAVGNFSGNVNNYMQLQMQNKSNGNSASTDFIATADNGNDTTDYIDFGINGSGYNQASYNIGGADDGYLYTSNGALSIGTAAYKPVVFNVNGTTSTNEAMRIDGNGYVSIGTQGVTNANAALTVNQTDLSGAGDIIAASTSGATRFRITNAGSVSLLGGLTSDVDTLTGTTLKIGATTQNGLTVGRSGAVTTLNGSSITLGAATGVSGALTITSNTSTALTVGANGSANPVLQVDASTGSVATGLKVLGAATGGTTAVSVIDSGTNANLSIDAKGSGTIIVGGTSTGNIIIGGSTNGLTFNTATGPTYAGTGRPAKEIVLSAEYPGAVLTASGSATITGSMTANASPSATPNSYDWQNYYQWTANADGALQDYTVAVRVTLPKDFSAWATGNCMTIAYNTGLTTNTKNALEVYIYKDQDTSGIPVAFSTGNASGTSKNWTTVNFTSASFAGTKTWNTAGGIAVIYLRLRSANPVNYVQVGDITLNYLAAF